MNPNTDSLSGDAGRARMLAAILEAAPARRGATIVARVERATSAIKDVQSMSTPEPWMDGEVDRCFADEYIGLLSTALCSVATSMVPPRTWTGTGWSVPQDELITVVCRDGDAAISRYETQFHYGWRFSNHLSNAFDGEIFALTPTGWVALYAKEAGASPLLNTSEWGGHW